MGLRRAAVAGTWYPGAAMKLRSDVESYMARVESESTNALPADADVIALVAPHAGLMYSGPVAAYSYSLLRHRRFSSVVLVGPSHYLRFGGASIWPRGAFETPLGDLPIDEELAADIVETCPVISDVPEAHAREHSLEMQLPFLAALGEGTPIVPIVMGFQTRQTAFALADGIARAARDRRALLVASSDLSHFYDAATAASLDRKVLSRVEVLDDEGLMALLEHRADHACGGGPMVTVLRAARALGATSSRVLQYADSGDISGDKSSVVGYMAAALWR